MIARSPVHLVMRSSLDGQPVLPLLQVVLIYHSFPLQVNVSDAGSYVCEVHSDYFPGLALDRRSATVWLTVQSKHSCWVRLPKVTSLVPNMLCRLLREVDAIAQNRSFVTLKTS